MFGEGERQKTAIFCQTLAIRQKIWYTDKNTYGDPVMKIYSRLLALLLSFILLVGCTPPPIDPPRPPFEDCTHADADDNGHCDDCGVNVLVILDLYAINDLHGKLADGDTHPGVDEMTTYLKTAIALDDRAILLSAGDMWQGSSESNLTKGLIMTDWMNALDFAAMTLGNHEYDWGEDAIEQNAKAAEFPLLAINVYDRQTNERVDYCEASVLIEQDGLIIGIIGACTVEWGMEMGAKGSRVVGSVR
jgi:hypothetical protein